jgi:hypothetical protein
MGDVLIFPSIMNGSFAGYSNLDGSYFLLGFGITYSMPSRFKDSVEQ